MEDKNQKTLSSIIRRTSLGVLKRSRDNGAASDDSDKEKNPTNCTPAARYVTVHTKGSSTGMTRQFNNSSTGGGGDDPKKPAFARSYSFRRDKDGLMKLVSARDDDLLGVDQEDTPEERKKRSLLVLYPDNAFRRFWDIVVLVLLAYTIVVMPLRVAFSTTTNLNPQDLTVEILFGIDILVNFFSAYEDQMGNLVTDLRSIMRHYLATWFIPDTLAVFPFYAVGEASVSSLSGVLKIPRLLKVLRLVRILKLLRTYKLKKFFEDLEFSSRIHQGLLRILRLTFCVLAVGHFSACLWYFIGELKYVDDDDPSSRRGVSWLNRRFPDGFDKEDDVLYLYGVSLYYAITTLTTVGYGDITSQTQGELWFTIVLMLVGATTFSYITATVSSVIADADTRAAKFREQMTVLLQFMNRTTLSPQLRAVVVKQMSHIWRNPRQMKDARPVLDEIPRDLRMEVAVQIHSALIAKSEFFQTFYDDHHAFVAEVCSKLRPQKASVGEYICNAGDKTDTWYVIETGEVEFVSPTNVNTIYAKLEDGQCFGFVGMFLTHHWLWHVRVVRASTLHVMSTRDMFDILGHHTACKRIAVRMANQMLVAVKNVKNRELEKQNEKHKSKKSPGVEMRLGDIASMLTVPGAKKRAAKKKGSNSLPDGAKSNTLAAATSQVGSNSDALSSEGTQSAAAKIARWAQRRRRMSTPSALPSNTGHTGHHHPAGVAPHLRNLTRIRFRKSVPNASAALQMAQTGKMTYGPADGPGGIPGVTSKRHSLVGMLPLSPIPSERGSEEGGTPGPLVDSRRASSSVHKLPSLDLAAATGIPSSGDDRGTNLLPQASSGRPGPASILPLRSPLISSGTTGSLNLNSAQSRGERRSSNSLSSSSSARGYREKPRGERRGSTSSTSAREDKPSTDIDVDMGLPLRTPVTSLLLPSVKPHRERQANVCSPPSPDDPPSSHSISMTAAASLSGVARANLQAVAAPRPQSDVNVLQALSDLQRTSETMQRALAEITKSVTLMSHQLSPRDRNSLASDATNPGARSPPAANLVEIQTREMLPGAVPSIDSHSTGSTRQRDSTTVPGAEGQPLNISSLTLPTGQIDGSIPSLDRPTDSSGESR